MPLLMTTIIRIKIVKCHCPLKLRKEIRATPAVSQNWEQKLFLYAKGEKRCYSSGAIAGAKIWLLNSDKPNLAKYS